MQGRKTSLMITLTQQEKDELRCWRLSTTIPAGLARRARIIIMRASGTSISEILRRVGGGRRHIYKWINRFLEHRIDGLFDKPGRGRKPFFRCGGRRVCG